LACWIKYQTIKKYGETDESDGQLPYPEALGHDSLNAMYKRKIALPEVSKTLSLQSSRGYFTD